MEQIALLDIDAQIWEVDIPVGYARDVHQTHMNADV